MSTDQLLADAARRARRYLETIGPRRVAPDEAALAKLSAFDQPLPESSSPATDTLALLDEIGSPATVATNAGRYFGFVNGASLPVATATSWLSTAWDQNAAVQAMSPVAAALDRVVHGWLVDLLGLPSAVGVAYVTGATMANATAIAVGRDELLRRYGWDVPSRGLIGAPELTVVVGAEAHSTIGKSLAFVGLGRDRVVVVPADAQGRMAPSQLPDVDGPVLVCAQAGNVNTGALLLGRPSGGTPRVEIRAAQPLVQRDRLLGRSPSCRSFESSFTTTLELTTGPALECYKVGDAAGLGWDAPPRIDSFTRVS